MLHLCQEQEGYVGDEVIEYVSRRLDLPPAHVKGVVTFYTLFNQHPVGKHQVWVCRTLPCALRGAYDVIEHCEKRLGIKCGETTPDGKVTLRTAECLASCGTAPMMQVDKDYHENLTRERVDAILERASGELRRMLKRTDYLTRTYGKPEGWTLRDVRARARRLRGGPARAHDDDPRAGRRGGQEGEHPRPRRRRLPHGREVELHAQDRWARSRTTSWSTPTRASRARTRTAR